MEIEIESNVIRYYLKNVYFINGSSCAGKSTMVNMLAERYNLIKCCENYHESIAQQIAVPLHQPGLCYFQTMSGWPEFLNRTPQQYADWTDMVSREIAQIEIAELIRISQNNIVIVDTNIPIDILHEISDYNHVAIMISPPTMSVNNFFDREDEDKKFLLEQINKCENPKKTMENFKDCVAHGNSIENYNALKDSGFFTVIRDNTGIDTKEETLALLVEHFNFSNKVDEHNK